jgi:hypothetical protein
MGLSRPRTYAAVGGGPTLDGLREAPMEPVHVRYVRIETGISIVLNAVVGAVFVRLMFGGRSTVGLWGTDGLAFDLLPTVFMITLMTTIALTLITRARVRKGAVPPMTDMGPRLPRPAPVRALLLAGAAALAIVPVSVLALWAVWTGPWSYGAVMAFKIAFSALVGLLVTPPILRAALRDGERVATIRPAAVG